MESDVDDPPGQAESGEAPANVLILPTSVERELDQSDESLGALGRPFDHRCPFLMGLTGALGVGVAYVLFRGVADISSVLVIFGLALFIAVGLDPILVFLVNRGLARGVAVLTDDDTEANGIDFIQGLSGLIWQELVPSTS
jgi:hypothetical protein